MKIKLQSISIFYNIIKQIISELREEIYLNFAFCLLHFAFISVKIPNSPLRFWAKDCIIFSYKKRQKS